MFGGCSETACPIPSQTWRFTGGQWSNITLGATQPPARAFASMSYDSRAGQVMLFGGWAGPGRPLADTWAFSGGNWTNVTNTSQAPPARYDAGMVFDHTDGYSLLFGGMNASGVALNDTWRLQLGQWKNFTMPTLPAPRPRWGASFSWDDSDGYALLFGGTNGTAAKMNDTWEYSKGKWGTVNLTGAPPPARSDASMTHFGVDGATYLVGGNGTSGLIPDVWRYSAAHWTNVSALLGTIPGPRVAAASMESAVAWTPTGAKMKNGYLLLFGGGARACTACTIPTYRDTWVFEPIITVTPTVVPSVVEAGEPAVFAATAIGGSSPYVYHWQFGDGTMSATQSPSHAYGNTGLFTAQVSVSDGAGVSANETVSLIVIAGPSVSLVVGPTTTDVDRPVTFGANPAGGTAPYTVRWSYGDGSVGTGTSGSHIYGVAGTYSGNATVTDSVGGTGTTSFTVVVNGALTVTATLPTGVATVGTNLSFSINVTGGTPPYSYSWTFGDGAVATDAATTHAYASAGVFHSSAVTSDSVGAVRWQNFTVTVQNATQPPPPEKKGNAFPAWYPWAIGPGAAAAAVAALLLVLYFRRRRRRPLEAPIAAAAVGQPAWAEREPEAHGDTRSARRSASRGHRR